MLRVHGRGQRRGRPGRSLLCTGRTAQTGGPPGRSRGFPGTSSCVGGHTGQRQVGETWGSRGPTAAGDRRGVRPDPALHGLFTPCAPSPASLPLTPQPGPPRAARGFSRSFDLRHFTPLGILCLHSWAHFLSQLSGVPWTSPPCSPDAVVPAAQAPAGGHPAAGHVPGLLRLLRSVFQ